MSEFRRRLMMARKAKPYDAEVEYLQSSGTQYIDTGIKPNNKYSFDTKVAMTQNAFNCVFWGVRSKGTYSTTGRQCYLKCNTEANSSDKNIRFFSTNANSSANWDGGLMNVGQMYEYTNLHCVSEMYEMTYPITLFALNTIGTINTSVGVCLIGGFTAYNDGVKVMDLIPVRKNGVGYMYDKVSGELFGNAGTGSFTYGNDKNS